MMFKTQNQMQMQVGMVRDQMKEKSEQQQITVMLVTVSFALLVFTFPQHIYYALYQFFVYDVGNKGFGQLFLVETLVSIWYVLNNCANIFLYCVSGKKFRDDLKTVFKGIYKQICQCTSTARSNLL